MNNNLNAFRTSQVERLKVLVETEKTSGVVSSIISKVKNSISEKINAHSSLKTYIIITIPIIFIIIYIAYKYNLNVRSSDVITNIYSKDRIRIKLDPLPQCYEVDITLQYKLCDYYICSSFMTPCVGNQHYDYVSADMITTVLQAGARYIQIPICEADITELAQPVIATAVYGQRVITSLNTLDLKLMLKLILSNAFKIQNKKINHPLIIHLILNTTNVYTLNTIADNISEVMSTSLVDINKYITMPIFLEKLCNLLGKIIIIATPQYIGTKLEQYIVPVNKLFNLYHFSELGTLNITPDDAFTNDYNKKLSSIQQDKSNKTFKKKYPSLNYIIDNINTVGADILNDGEILNNLTYFNKIGITIVKPQYPSDVISKNYDFTEAVYSGCQLPTMNFQINDVNMKNYIAMFIESSFRLKPSSMRFSEQEEPIKDMLAVYKTLINKDDTLNILNNFYSKYSDILIAFESYTLPNTFLTQVESDLKFSVGATRISNNGSSAPKYKLGLSQCFIPRKSKITVANNISVYLESANYPGLFITLTGATFILQGLASNTNGLVSQAFFIEKSRTEDKDHADIMISMRTTTTLPMYLAYENKNVKAYANLTQDQAQNNMSFAIHTIAFKHIIKIITLYNGSFKTMSGNIVGVLEDNIDNGTSYYVIPMNRGGGNNFNLFKDQFVLQNTVNKTYIMYDHTTLFLYDREDNGNNKCVFNINKLNGYYTLSNPNNQNLILFNTNLIKFANSNDIETNENLFKIDITYELE